MVCIKAKYPGKIKIYQTEKKLKIPALLTEGPPGNHSCTILFLQGSKSTVIDDLNMKLLCTNNNCMAYYHVISLPFIIVQLCALFGQVTLVLHGLFTEQNITAPWEPISWACQSQFQHF